MTMVHRASQIEQRLRRPVRRKILTSFEFVALSRHFQGLTVTSDIAGSGFPRSPWPVPLVTIVVTQYGNGLFRIASKRRFRQSAFQPALL